MPGVSFLPNEKSHTASATSEESYSTSIRANVNTSSSFSQSRGSMESVKRSYENDYYNDTEALNCIDEIYGDMNATQKDPSMDKKLVIVLVVAGSLALLFMLIVGASLPDDGEFGAQGSVSINEIDEKINKHNYQIVPLPPEDIDILCDDNLISQPHGYSICRQACKFSECCMLNSELEGSCMYGDNRKICALYQQSCEKVYDKKNDTDVVKNVTVYDKMALQNICSNQNTSSDEEVRKCQDACKPAICCFQPYNTSESCQSPKTKTWCDMFSPCSKISFHGSKGITNKTSQTSSNTTSQTYNTTQTDDITSQIDNTTIPDSPKIPCSESYIAHFGYSQCEETCRKGSCCFDSNTKCSNEIDCSVYDLCSLIHGAG